jgi:hypothetical protein
MFIKKDARKLAEVVADAHDDRAQLKLARRGPEFRGDTRALFTADNAPAFARTRYLSLYNNKLASVNGLSTLAGAPLADLVLSNNELTALPTSLGGLAGSLRRLYAEDNALRGAVPQCVLRLTQLRVLRLSGNQFTELPEALCALTELEELALEGNALAALPAGLGGLRALRVLLLRGNRLQRLPDSIGACAALATLALSSNDLRELPEALGGCAALASLSVNGNPRLAALPAGLARCARLQRCVAAHCSLAALPLPLVCAWAGALPAEVVAGAHALALRAAAAGAGEGAAAGEGEGAAGAGADLSLWEASLAEDLEGAEGGGGGGGEEAAGAQRQLLGALRAVPAALACHVLPFHAPAGGGAPPPLAALALNIDGNPCVAEARALARAREECAGEFLRELEARGGSGAEALAAVLARRSAAAAGV